MSQSAEVIQLPDEDRATLEGWVRAHSSSQQVVKRARVVLMAAPDAETARQIVRTLVEERIAACGTILPAVTSVYRWRGEVEDAAEALVVFKTTAAGHGPYLDWVLENVSGGT